MTLKNCVKNYKEKEWRECYSCQVKGMTFKPTLGCKKAGRHSAYLEGRARHSPNQLIPFMLKKNNSY